VLFGCGEKMWEKENECVKHELFFAYWLKFD
jgi:hypothetical protein